jgi:hypothetical protein
MLIANCASSKLTRLVVSFSSWRTVKDAQVSLQDFADVPAVF